VPAKTAAKAARENVSPMFEAGERKSAKRAAKSDEAPATPARARARKG
jgi:hypothetical protein